MQPLMELMDTDKKRISSVESHQGRRFQKRIEEYQSGSWNEIELTRFLYDDWNLIAEYDATSGSNTLSRTYTWGLDLSLSPQGAGGVGGLLSMTEESSSETFYYAYDANGNVTQLIDEQGAIAAHYEYSPFGQLTTATGPMADENPFRFSTKYQDEATGLLYYGFRYYDAETGRWLNRDPIGKDGGVNVSGFLQNQPLAMVDILGKNFFRTTPIGVGVGIIGEALKGAGDALGLCWSNEKKFETDEVGCARKCTKLLECPTRIDTKFEKGTFIKHYTFECNGYVWNLKKVEILEKCDAKECPEGYNESQKSPAIAF